jgi:hypothetical protein
VRIYRPASPTWSKRELIKAAFLWPRRGEIERRQWIA